MNQNRKDQYRNYRSDGPGPLELEGKGFYHHGENFSGIGPRGYKRSDNSIEEEVCEILVHEHRLDIENVYISVEDGVVRLSGSVMSREQKFIIEDIVEQVSGVAEVQNRLQVTKNVLPESGKLTFGKQLD